MPSYLFRLREEGGSIRRETADIFLDDEGPGIVLCKFKTDIVHPHIVSMAQIGAFGRHCSEGFGIGILFFDFRDLHGRKDGDAAPAPEDTVGETYVVDDFVHETRDYDPVFRPRVPGNHIVEMHVRYASHLTAFRGPQTGTDHHKNRRIATVVDGDIVETDV